MGRRGTARSLKQAPQKDQTNTVNTQHGKATTTDHPKCSQKNDSNVNPPSSTHKAEQSKVRGECLKIGHKYGAHEGRSYC